MKDETTNPNETCPRCKRPVSEADPAGDRQTMIDEAGQLWHRACYDGQARETSDAEA